MKPALSCPLLTVLLLTLTAEGWSEPARLAGGPREGMYWRLAKDLENHESRRALQAVETAGSVENLRDLESGSVRFAFAQQDVVSDYFRNHPRTQVRVVGRLFFDYLHIFLRDPVRVRTAGELGRLRIWAGEAGSGTRLTASRFLDRLGMPISALGERGVTLADLEGKGEPAGVNPLDRLPGWFQEERLDAAMLVTTPGQPTVCRLMESERVHLLPLDPKTLRELTEKEETTFRRQTAIGRIPAGTYRNQASPVATIAVPVLLLTRSGEKPEIASALLAAARDRWRSLALASLETRGGCVIPDASPQAAPLRESGLTMLEGLPDSEPAWPKNLPPVQFLLALLAVSALGLWGWRRGWHHQIHGVWRQDRLPFMLVLLLATAILLVTVITYAAERGINENFSSIPESFWSINVYLFSGLEDRTPYTPTGRVVATLGLLLGPAFFAVMSGWLARFFIQREKHMPHNLTNHFLLLNWSDRAADVVRQIHHPVIREREGTFVVVVLTDDENLDIRRFKEAGSGRDEAFEDFYISVGDPTDERALLNANAQDARAILILPHSRYGDECTIRSILMLRKIACAVGRTDLHVVADVSNPANNPVFDELAKDFPGLLERISGLQLQTFLLSQAALSIGITAFYSDLLQVSANSNEMYTLEVPDAAIGMPFREYSTLIFTSGTAEEPLIPVGIQRMADGKARILTNPRRGEAGWILEKGDRLVVIAYLPPLPSCLPIPAGALA